MDRRSLLLLAMQAPGKAQEANFFERLSEFHQAYDKFIRTLKGCPSTGYDESACVGGEFDYKQWNKVKKLAKAAFEL